MADESLSYAAPPNGLRMLIDRLLAAEKRIAALEGASPLRQAGVTATKTGLTADRSLTVNGDFASTGNADVDGTLNVAAVTTLGGDTSIVGTLDVTGDATIGGNLDLAGNGEVTGVFQSENFVAATSGWRLTSTGLEVNTLTAKDAIIGNQALASPVVPMSGTQTNGSAETLPTSAANFATVTISVPAGFTTAHVFAVSSVGIVGTQAAVFTTINGNIGPQMNVVTNNGSTSHSALLTGLSGGTIYATTRAYGVSGGGTIYATTTMFVTFYR